MAKITRETYSWRCSLARKETWHPTWSHSSGDWSVDFRVSGRRIRKKLGLADRGLRDLAIQTARELYREAWEASAKQQPAADAVTFAEAARLYIGAGGEERFLPKIVMYFGPEIQVRDVDALAVERAAGALYPDAKPETVRRQLRVPIRAVQNFALGKRRERIEDTRRVRWLSPEEAERLLASAAQPEKIGLRDPNRETLRKIVFMLGTGAGPGETMALTGEGWNAATREWWLPGTKFVYRARFVCLPERTVSLIGEIPENGPSFVAPNGQPYVMTEALLRNSDCGRFTSRIHAVRRVA
ncbi:hypothetical protein [Citreimonas salinaria]|uniref:Phage integrase family protein n=1 Tax=Citreimonas salinaria TaxID=321339 RepID=A0A1H3NVK1_9RHOB|nr:hypothetical protein [Citreimonas salinaria]SDY92179.1 hypothetical protein SAMN05444340_1312 [Citreimonas salinaria]